MNQRPMSPMQIRAHASRAMRQQRLTTPATPDQLQAVLLTRLAAMAPPGLRMPMPGETPLSPQEITHGLYYGLINAGRTA